MTPKEYYHAHRDEILEKRRNEYARKKRQREYKREWTKNNPDKVDAYKKKRKAMYKTEAYRAKHRAYYRIRHAKDPMTEQRRRCIEAADERMAMTLEERKAIKIAKQAEKVAKFDIQKTYQQGEEEETRKRETVIKYIKRWTQRKIFATTTDKSGKSMSEADVRAYYKEACKYFELEKRIENTSPTDYSTRNVLIYKMRVIEDRFNTLLNKKLKTKSIIQQSL